HPRRTFSRDGTASSGMAGDSAAMGPFGETSQRPVRPPFRRYRVNVVVLGATRGIGRALARRLAERGDRIFLLARDLTDLERSARDIEIRANRSSSIGVAHCDLSAPESFVPAMEAALAELSTVEAVVVTAGDFATQPALEADLERTRHLLTVNFTNTVLF